MSRLTIIATVALVLAATADATEYVVAKFLGVSPGQQVTIYDYSSSPRLKAKVWAGVYNFQIQSGTTYTELGGVDDVFSTYCIDIGNWVSKNHAYTWTVVDLTDAPVPFLYSDGKMSAAEQSALQKLYGQSHAASLASAPAAAAFQAAVWEIVNESGSAWDISSGNFKATGIDATTVNTLLANSVSYDGPLPTLKALTSNCTQDQVFLLPGYGPPPPPPYVIPEPVSLAMVVLSLSGLGGYLRKRLAAPAGLR